MKSDAHNSEDTQNIKEEKKENKKDLWMCTVCWENEYYPLILGCGHSICQHCLAQLKEKRCVECRANIQFFTPNYVVGNALGMEYKEYKAPPPEPTTHTNENTNSNTDSTRGRGPSINFGSFRVPMFFSEEDFALLEPFLPSPLRNLRHFRPRQNTTAEAAEPVLEEEEAEVEPRRFPLQYIPHMPVFSRSFWFWTVLIISGLFFLFFLWKWIPKEFLYTCFEIFLICIFILFSASF